MNQYYDEYPDLYYNKVSYNISRGVYRFLGKGSGRTVYDMGNGKVVKTARNKRGIAQNIAEYQIALADDSGLFAGISDVSGDYRYLIMDKAERISNMAYVWDYFQVNSNQELYRVKRLSDLSDRYNLLIHDFGRAVNWGFINGRPVIIDYGFTQQVRRRYYPAKRNNVPRS